MAVLVMMMMLNLVVILILDGVARVGGGQCGVTLDNAGKIDNVDSDVGYAGNDVRYCC